MDIDVINRTISELMDGATTFQSVDRLASLLIVKEHMLSSSEPEAEPIMASERDMNLNGSGELMDAVRGKDINRVMDVFQEHLESVRIVYPKEYDLVLQKLRDI